MSLAQLGLMTNNDLHNMEDALRTFHNHKEVFEELRPVSTNKGFHGIPKIHMISHYMHLIRELGTPDGYNTETLERLHIDFAKLGYQASNKVNTTKQMALYIQQLKAIKMHATYLSELAVAPKGAQEGSSGGKRAVADVGMRSEPELAKMLDGEEGEEEWDSWHNDKEDEDPDELINAGVRMKRLVDFKETVRGEHWGQPWVVKSQLPKEGVVADLLMFHPNPEHVLAKTPTTTASGSYIVRKHGGEWFLDALNSFVAKEASELWNIKFNADSIFNIWSHIRLFHSPLPFQPSKGPHTNVIRAQPQKVDQ